MQGWGRFRASAIVAVLLVSGFLGLIGGISEDVQAAPTTFYCNPGVDGQVLHSGPAYPPYGTSTRKSVV